MSIWVLASGHFIFSPTRSNKPRPKIYEAVNIKNFPIFILRMTVGIRIQDFTMARRLLRRTEETQLFSSMKNVLVMQNKEIKNYHGLGVATLLHNFEVKRGLKNILSHQYR